MYMRAHVSRCADKSKKVKRKDAISAQVHESSRQPTTKAAALKHQIAITA